MSHIKDVFNLLQYSSAAFLPVSKLADLSSQVGNSLNRVCYFLIWKSYPVILSS